MKNRYKSKPSTRDTIWAWFLLTIMGAGPILGLIFLNNAVNKYKDVYQFKANSDAQGRTMLYDGPLLEGNKLFLDEKDKGHCFFCWDFKKVYVENGQRVLVAGSDQPLKLRIYFVGYDISIEEYWRGKEASLFIQGGLDTELAGYPGNMNTQWGDSLSDKYKDISPYFDVTLPIQEIDLSIPWQERVLQVNAKIIYLRPVKSNVGIFKNHTNELDHTFELAVLTPDEVEEYLVVRGNERSRGIPNLLLGISLGLLVIAASIIVPIKIGKIKVA